MARFGLFGRHKEKTEKHGPDLTGYAGLQVTVTEPDGRLLSAGKLLTVTGTTAELLPYAGAANLAHVAVGSPAQIRGFSSREKHAVCMAGNLTPGEDRVWLVENLVLLRVGNDRAFFRVDTDIPARLVSGESGAEQAARICNLSMGGACVQTRARLKAGDQFTLVAQLRAEQPLYRIATQVVRITDRVRSGFEYGCRFLHQTDAQQEDMAQILFDFQRNRVR